MVGNPPSAAKVFGCPSCGAPVTLRAQGQSLSVVCGSCGSVLDPTTEENKILSQFKIRTGFQPLIPLGARGKLRGDDWECIGFVERITGGGQYSWEEYLLFNPYKGYRWLTVYNGHWIFAQMTKEKPILAQEGVSLHGTAYRSFQCGSAKVNYVLGEFYWRVKVGDEVAYMDYIAPPYILSTEGDRSERIWSHGLYVEPDEVSAAFRLRGKMPWRSGVGSCQPSPYSADCRAVFGLSIAFCVVIILIHKLSAHPNPGNLVFGFLMIGLGLFVCSSVTRGFEAKRWGESDLTK